MATIESVPILPPGIKDARDRDQLVVFVVKVLVRVALFSAVLGKLFGPSSSMTVTIPTLHPDDAGGLGSLGRYAIGMSLLAAAALVFPSMAAWERSQTTVVRKLLKLVTALGPQHVSSVS